LVHEPHAAGAVNTEQRLLQMTSPALHPKKVHVPWVHRSIDGQGAPHVPQWS
jgi:hypothetical protein